MDNLTTAHPSDDPYRQRTEDVLAALGSDPHLGLSRAEAQARLDRHGPNELATDAPRPAWRTVLAQFRSVLVLLLLAAALVSAGLWLVERKAALPYEALAILAVVLLNALLGAVQQSRADQAVAALRRMSAAQANVVRGGERQAIAAAGLVPGDLMLIEEGDTVSADARLLHSASLHMAETALTGESLPAPKDTAAIAEAAGVGDRGNMVFSGTSAASGRGQAVVTATGPQTEMGGIARLLKEMPDEATPLQRELDRVGKMLGISVVAIAAAMIGTLLAVQEVHGFQAVFAVLMLGVALAVAAVPEGLPAVVTAVLALGVQRLAHRRAIVRRLAAVETLGSATVIASDKTGTLTRNEMTVRRVVTASGRVELAGTGYAPTGEVQREGGGAIEGALRRELDDALTAASRASNAVVQERDGRWTVQGDPTEGALVVAARKAGLQDEALAALLPRVGEVPFSSSRKLMSSVHRDPGTPGRLRVFTKGAPDVLLGRCTHELAGKEARPLTDERRLAILEGNERLAGDALRTLGIASRTLPDGTVEAWNEGVEQDLVFLGLVGMMDPPRDEAKQAVERARSAGIRPIMITGDHPGTAAAGARRLWGAAGPDQQRRRTFAAGTQPVALAGRGCGGVVVLGLGLGHRRRPAGSAVNRGARNCRPALRQHRMVRGLAVPQTELRRLRGHCPLARVVQVTWRPTRHGRNCSPGMSGSTMVPAVPSRIAPASSSRPMPAGRPAAVAKWIALSILGPMEPARNSASYACKLCGSARAIARARGVPNPT